MYSTVEARPRPPHARLLRMTPVVRFPLSAFCYPQQRTMMAALELDGCIDE